MLIPETPKDKKELQSWLIQYQKGDKITHGHPNLWDVRLVTDMSDLFNKKELRDFNEDISAWDVSNVKSMAGMFFQAKSFNQPIGNWNVQNVSNMNGMFCKATPFNQPIGNWNVENVSNMKGMFSDASSFKQTLPDEWAKKATYGKYEK
jgi:surface protein